MPDEIACRNMDLQERDISFLSAGHALDTGSSEVLSASVSLTSETGRGTMQLRF
jgi:hypothetical protein